MVNLRKIKAQMVLVDINQEQLANALNLNLRTLVNRFQKPWTFRQEELEIMINVLEIEDPIDIFFDKK